MFHHRSYHTAAVKKINTGLNGIINVRAREIVKGCIQFVGSFIWGVTDAIIVLYITQHNQENIRRVMVC